MIEVNIEQVQMANHPGVLTESDISELIEDLPSGAEFPRLIGSGRPKAAGHCGLVGELTVAVSFVAGGLATAALSELGKDIYKWVKKKMLLMMEQKRNETKSEPGIYKYKAPEWQLNITIENDDGNCPFRAKIHAVDPSAMDKAMKNLLKELINEAPGWCFDQYKYSWSAEEVTDSKLWTESFKYKNDENRPESSGRYVRYKSKDV